MSQHSSQKKNSSNWIYCEKCSSSMLNRDSDKHLNDCPPNINNINYHFIKEYSLYGILDLKTNEEVKNLSSREVDNLVFLSQTVIQMCSLAIGQWAIIELLNKKVPPVAKIVWPTTEKTVTSVLLTKNGLGCFDGDVNDFVRISKAPSNLKMAYSIQLIFLSNQKMLDLNTELYNRISKSHIGHILTTGSKISIMFYGKLLKFEIKGVTTKENSDLETNFQNMYLDEKNQEIYKIDECTKWQIYQDEDSFRKEVYPAISQVNLAGVDKETNEIREIMKLHLHRSSISPFHQTRSVLIYGKSGTGKTSIAKALAKETKATSIAIFAHELYNKTNGSVEDNLRHKFQMAIDQQPSVIIIDEIDIFCPIRSSKLTDFEKRTSAVLMQVLDNVSDLKNCKVFIIATSSKIENIDPAFRRFGRLDREIELPTPSPQSRKEILNTILNMSSTKFDTNIVEEMATHTHGFVAADLASLCSQACMSAVKRQSDCVSLEDFKLALKKVIPNAMREVQVEVPNIKWSDIGGQHNLKLILKQSVEWPLKYPQSFQRLGIDPPRGVLMFGPPGCSKTMIAKALATESGLNFLSIKGPELFSKWVGESERAVREVFSKARQVAPSIIFFDEIDALGSERTSGSSTSVQERVLAQLLTELDGITPLGDVTIIAATNRPDRIDKALLRPGRLDRIVYVSLPDQDTRKEIFQIKFSKMPVHNINLESIVNETEGYSGAEVNAVCHEAAMAALEEDLEIKYVEYRHFQKALKLITPRTPPSLIALYEEYFKNKNLG